MIVVNLFITSTKVEIKFEAEIHWIKIQCKGHHDIYIASCYRPIISDKTFTTHLEKSLDQLMTRGPRATIVGGDFNLSVWDWSEISLKLGTQYTTQHTEFQELLVDFGLTQCVIEPTRKGNILDLIATNLIELVNRVKGYSRYQCPRDCLIIASSRYGRCGSLTKLIGRKWLNILNQS